MIARCFISKSGVGVDIEDKARLPSVMMDIRLWDILSKARPEENTFMDVR